MIAYYVETVQDVSDPVNPQTRFIVRAPNHKVGFGDNNLETAYLGCMALALGFSRYDVEEMAAERRWGR